MRRLIATLLEPAPVMLEPVLRRSRREEIEWRLPERPGSRTLLTFHATAAIYQCVRALRIRAGDNVVLPAYNCGHEVEPVLRAGAEARFFRVSAALENDLDDLERALDARTRAVVVTHYFGFPQRLAPLRELCEGRGIALLEDCAHALFSCDGERPIGLDGDFAVYSLRKTLALAHGGAAVCHDPERPWPEALPPPPRLSTWSKWLERYQKSLLLPRPGLATPVARAGFLAARLGVDLTRALGAVARRSGALQWDPDEESFGFPSAVLDWGVADSVRRALRRADPQAVVAARRRNFAALLQASGGFSGCRPLLTALPDGVCPLNFPVVSDDPARLLRRLAAGAISAVDWWGAFHPAVPWERFPEASRLKETIVVLPVHQDLERVHIDRAIERLCAAR